MFLSSALMCLALNIYHEARGEDLIGQYAVALVTMNRADYHRNRVCHEVLKPAQFSWTNEMVFNQNVVSSAGLPRDPVAWAAAKKVAHDVLEGKVVDFTGGATHYHANYVRPKWKYRMRHVMTLGRHLFYRSSY